VGTNGIMEPLMVSRAAVVILLTVRPSRSWFATQAWEPVRKVQHYTLPTGALNGPS